MKINKNSVVNNKKRNILLLVITLGLVLSSVFIFWYVNRHNSIQNNREITEQNDNTSGKKQSQVINPQTTTKDTSNSRLPQKNAATSNSPASSDHESTTTISSDVEKPAITRAEQSGDMIKVVATYSNTPRGNCQLRATIPNQTTLSYEAPIVIGPSYYVCSFTIPVSSFPVSGNWTVNLFQQVDTSKSESASVILEVK
jgi:cytoskeletal protein RodZ